MQLITQLKRLALIALIGSLLGCVKVEHHQYACNEQSIKMNGLDGLELAISIVGQSQKQVDTMLYSHHHIGSPYEAKVFFSGPSDSFADFKVLRSHVDFKEGEPATRHRFQEIETVAVHRSNDKTAQSEESHVIELKPGLKPAKYSDFRFELSGQLTVNGKMQNFDYSCTIEYELSSETGLAFVN